MKRIEIDSLSELNAVAETVIESLEGRNVVVFRAPMGAGKTTLISRIVALLGAEDTVTSPTFALVNQYEGSERRIYHFDFYRIMDPEEAEMLGLNEFFGEKDSVSCIEWSENIAELLPRDCIVVTIEKLDENSRQITIQRYL